MSGKNGDAEPCLFEVLPCELSLDGSGWKDSTDPIVVGSGDMGMIRQIVTPANGDEAAILDRLVASFAEELAAHTSECMFYMSDPDAKAGARIIETETRETLDRFLSFVAAKIGNHAI